MYILLFIILLPVMVLAELLKKSKWWLQFKHAAGIFPPFRSGKHPKQPPHAGFVDDGCILHSADGVANRDSILILVFNVFRKCIARISVSRRFCCVLTDKPRFAVLLNNSEFSKLCIVKYLNVCR